jgi:endonuclease/exonuclease/phosphatase family metal-dependent hydrolase
VKRHVVGTHLAYLDDETTDQQVQSLLEHLPTDNLLFLAGDFNAHSGSPAVQRIPAAGFTDALPDGIDHLFIPIQEKTSWRMARDRLRWTLRPQDLAEIIGKDIEISDHPAILAEFICP